MKAFVFDLVLIGALGFAFVADSALVQSNNPCPPNFTGNIPNPEDCHSFYICDAGRPGLIPCPVNLCYSPVGGEGDGGACTECSEVPGCGSGVTAVPTAPPSTTSQVTSTSKSTAESGQPSTSTQVPPETSRPTQDPTTSPQPTPSSTTTQRTTTANSGDLQCPADVPYIYMPYPGDCNKFYYCQNGDNTGVYNCGQGLWFNFKQQVCSLPWGSSCEN